MAYDVNADIYEGPLLLMVELAKHNLLDVFLIKLQDLTAQYRTWVKDETVSLNQLAEPLPLLGQLLALKARRLLPVPPPAMEDEDAPISLEELERRLREYEQFKSVAQVLAELHTLQHDHLTRLSPGGLDELKGQPGAESEPEESRALAVGLLDLMSAFSKVLTNAKTPMYEMEQEAWTVEMKVDELKVMLSVKHQIGFGELFSSKKSTLELVVTFLALLELVRQRMCAAIQERPFGEILIVRPESRA